MKFLVAVTLLVAFAMSSPIPTPTPIAHHQQVSVHLRIIDQTPDNTRYTSPNQTPSNNDGRIMTIPVGQTFTFDHKKNPLLLYRFGIVGVEGLETGDQDVYCKASMNYSSESVVVSMEDGMVTLDEEKREAVVVTALWCEFEKGKA